MILGMLADSVCDVITYAVSLLLASVCDSVLRLSLY